jgi:ketose-bisphosphate aldolase
MPLVGTKDILVKARQQKYGVPSLLAGDLQMVMGGIRAAEARRAPLILAFNQEVTPDIPLEVGISAAVSAARLAGVPVAVILDHGHGPEDVVRAIRHGAPSVMFDGSTLPYEENVRQTQEIVRMAHAAGVCVEAELGSIAGGGPGAVAASRFTDPAVAADFVARTGVDTLAVSFGNAHGVYPGEPRLDLERVREIHAAVAVPLVMHGASGLPEAMYPQIVESGISKVCYYTAMGIGAAHDLRSWLCAAEAPSPAGYSPGTTAGYSPGTTAGYSPGTTVYHHIIARSIDYFYRDTRRLLDLLGCSGVVA